MAHSVNEIILKKLLTKETALDVAYSVLSGVLICIINF